MAVIPITPNGTTLRYRTVAFTQFFTADRSVTWSASLGATLAPATGPSTTVTVPNKTQTITVNAVSGADTGAVALQVYGTWPVHPHYGYEVGFDNKTLSSYDEDGGAIFVVKGKVRRSWSLSFNNIPSTDWQLIRDFWLFHQKHIPFYYEDIAMLEKVAGVETPTLRLVTADSGPKVIIAGPDRYNVTIVLREV